MARPVTLVTFVLPSTLTHWLGGPDNEISQVKVFAVAAGDDEIPTLGGALDTLRRTHPTLEERLRDEYGRLRRHIGIYVCGENARRLGGLECALPPGAEVYVLPALV